MPGTLTDEAKCRPTPVNRIQQRPLIGLIVNPFGQTARAIELEGEKLRVVRRGQTAYFPLASVSHPPSVRRGALGSTIAVPSDIAEDIVLRGARHADAQAFSDEVKQHWINLNLAAWERASDRFDHIHSKICALASPDSYPAACSVQPLLREARELDATLLFKLQRNALGPERMARIERVRKFAEDPKAVRENAIAAFVSAELDSWKEFFDTVESMPLTPEQRLSVLVDEDATLVLAGAGSGKTSVITAKAAYLVKAGIRQADEILLLAFAKNAAEEMSERVEARSGVPIVARTFHALAYDIIGHVEGSKPALADHATDDADTDCLLAVCPRSGGKRQGFAAQDVRYCRHHDWPQPRWCKHSRQKWL